jgi:hypothetical protein
MFKVVTEEAANNPAFGKRLEDALAKFGQELAERRIAERSVEGFHPHIAYKKNPQEFASRLEKFDAKELRVVIDRHGLDPAATLKGKAAKKVLAAHILAAAQKRAERDAKLFEY